MGVKSSTAISAQKSSEGAENATLIYAIGKQTVEKLERKKVQTVRSANNNRLQGASLKSERSALPQATNSGDTWLHPSSNEVMNITEICLEAKAKIALLSAKIYEQEGTMGINREIQVPALILFDTGSGGNLILKSIVLPS